jgi:hypothetical protein
MHVVSIILQPPAECNVGYGYSATGGAVTCSACENNSVSAGGEDTCETLCIDNEVATADHSSCVACDADANMAPNIEHTACGE